MFGPGCVLQGPCRQTLRKSGQPVDRDHIGIFAVVSNSDIGWLASNRSNAVSSGITTLTLNQ